MKSPLRICLTIVGVFVVLAYSFPSAHGQDFGECSMDEINSAIDELGCLADGVYLSPNSAAEQVAALCAGALSERSCRLCFARARGKLSLAFRTLAKLGFLERSAAGSLRQALREAELDACSDFNSPPPDDTPPPAETYEPRPPPLEPSASPSPEPTAPQPDETSTPYPTFIPTYEPPPDTQPTYFPTPEYTFAPPNFSDTPYPRPEYEFTPPQEAPGGHRHPPGWDFQGHEQ